MRDYERSSTEPAAGSSRAVPAVDSQTLRILGGLLAAPEEESAAALTDLLEEAPWFGLAVEEIGRIPLEHWQAEHTRLFVNGFPRTPCPPFESAYRQGVMQGSCVAELIGLYRRAGMEASGAPADYLGVLLELAAVLSEKPDGGGELLRELLGGHLRLWVPRFASDLQANARLELYRQIGARLARLFPGAPGD